MAGSLLAFLYPHIKGSQEDVATLSLCHIISQSEDLRAAFTEQILSKLGYGKQESLFYNTQVVGEKKERPDIVGFSANGTERIICEVKFFAALTYNQPNGYLNRLGQNENYGLIFLCPQSRIIGLWEQLKKLVENEEVEAVNSFCVAVNGVHMAIISWENVLQSLLQAASKKNADSLNDIYQLVAYCREIENEAFVPFKPEDFGADVARQIDRYYMVVDSVISLLLSKKEYKPSTSGLRATPRWSGLVRYIKVSDNCLGVFFNRMLWKKETSRCTPFWLSLNDNNWKQTGTMGEFLKTIPLRETEKDQEGHVYIALQAPVARTLEETAQELCDQILYYINQYNIYRERK